MGDWGNNAEIATAIATVAAVIVAGFAIRAKRRDNRRADRLERINRQLSQLYGKLSILHEAGARNWHSFNSQHGNDIKELDREFMRFFPFKQREDEPITAFNPVPPNAKQLKAYREWLKTLFIRTNEEMLQVIYDNADLVVGEKMHSIFVVFAEHVASLRILILKLEEEEKQPASVFLNDWEQYVKLTATYPPGMDYYISASFKVLKEEQERLLSTHNKPHTEKELANEIEQRQWAISDHWCKKEYEVRTKAGQHYKYKPMPALECKVQEKTLVTWWRKIIPS